MVDGWRGDDWFHNGAFRVGGFDFAVSQSTGKADAGASIPVGTGDDYTRYLEAGSMADYAAKYHIENIPFVQKLMQNPAYTDFWSLQAVDKWMAAGSVPYNKEFLIQFEQDTDLNGDPW